VSANDAAQGDGHDGQGAGGENMEGAGRADGDDVELVLDDEVAGRWESAGQKKQMRRRRTLMALAMTCLHQGA
jgi:hypothetical protein